MKVICVGVLFLVLVASAFSMPAEDFEDEAMIEEQPFVTRGEIHLAQL